MDPAKSDCADSFDQLKREIQVLREENARLTAMLSAHTGKPDTAEQSGESPPLHSVERSKAQFKFLPIPAFTWKWNGNDLVLLEFNEAADISSQGRVYEYVGRTASDICRERPLLLADLKRCFTERTTFRREMTYPQISSPIVQEMLFTYVFAAPDLVIVISEDVTENKRAEAALKESEERYRTLFENAPLGLGVANRNGKLVAFNDAMMQPGGYTRDDIIKIGSVANLYSDPEERKQALSLAQKQGFLHRHEVRFKRKDGGSYLALLSLRPITLDGQPGWQAMSEDISERKQLETQLLQSQKIESVGRLAGGVAHEFNNLLSGILGYAELLAIRLRPQQFDELEGIRRMSMRGAELTRQLLGFARKQHVNPTVLSLNDQIINIGGMLMRLIGEHIELVTDTGSGVPSVRADPGQLEQVLMNLTVNARDAMPGGGRLTISTSRLLLNSDAAKLAGNVCPGDYALVSVSDTGTGMNEEIQKHLFEPFFTTKEVGKGTGLGLATCYGIIRQHGGHIWSETQEGKGSRFKFILPAVSSPLDTAQTFGVTRLVPGNEVILVVEDDETVRFVVSHSLHNAGYKVLEATNGIEAMRIWESHGKKIDLLLTDVVMPRMGGYELAENLRKRRPALRVLFMSGYSRGEPLHPPDDTVWVLQKPFLPELLAQKVREVLDK